MAVLRAYNYFELQVDGEPARALGGLRGKPNQITVTGNVGGFAGSVATATTVTLWDAATSPCSSFAFFDVRSDRQVSVEFQGTSIANNFVVVVAANGIQQLTSDDILSYAAAGNFAGSSVDVKKILLRNSSGATATVRAVVVQ